MRGILGLAAVTQLAEFLDEGGDVIGIDEFAVAWCGFALFGVARCGAARYLAGWSVNRARLGRRGEDKVAVLVFVVSERIVGHGGGGIVCVGEVAVGALRAVGAGEA